MHATFTEARAVTRIVALYVNVTDGTSPEIAAVAAADELLALPITAARRSLLLERVERRVDAGRWHPEYYRPFLSAVRVEAGL